jgi:hypothetical protein
MPGQKDTFDGSHPYMTDEEAVEDEAREVALRLPKHDPDLGYRILMRAGWIYRDLRIQAGLVHYSNPEQEVVPFSVAGGDGDE